MSKIDLEQFAELENLYDFVDEMYDPDSTVPIRLKDEKYNGTIIRYDRIDMKEMSIDSNEATLSFHYEFIENPHNIGKHNAGFHNHLGDLLVNIIINTLNGGENETGNDNSKQPNEQRKLQSKGSPISE